MWDHPFTQQHLASVKNIHNTNQHKTPLFEILEPESRRLACGDIGKGALVSTDKIVDKVSQMMDLMHYPDILNSEGKKSSEMEGLTKKMILKVILVILGVISLYYLLLPKVTPNSI